MLFEVFSQRYERTSTLVTSNLPFAEWTEVLGSERLTGALLDRLTHHVHILELRSVPAGTEVEPLFDLVHQVLRSEWLAQNHRLGWQVAIHDPT